MEDKNNDVLSYTNQKNLIFLLIILMFVLVLIDINVLQENLDTQMITGSLLRILGGLVFIVIIYGLGHGHIFKFKNVSKALLIMIPAFIVSINNFPIIAFLDGRAVLTEPVYRVFLFFIESLSVGFFEEIIFRGMILVYLLNKLKDEKNGVMKSIILSSVIFGFIHVINIFNGASVNSTMLQIGYSFLVGMMWAVLFIKTGNLWLTMLLHATFNFFGQVMFYLGTVDGRYDQFTTVITIIIALLAAFHTLWIFRQIKNKTLFND
ncbi:CPBP family intramembrane glutamic endopeptidase [Peloplasma aerotolerans]|uniref:CPBP family intramembrane metalloprotease n=1 Tax=Peloplasma aerotolerans TaxID=3044389 RepID=A0AAW6UDC2_9MOLU|nr:CPBP family intramembrane glutamic endopeptidase [Mariniplasma sp. M4Ah]MDI6452983.1 CPBP family intramembrane metalloprotease [Mariniplasma sp. M4Ah]